MNAPTYRWICFKCGAANEPHTEQCNACRFAANASPTQIKAALLESDANSNAQGSKNITKSGTSAGSSRLLRDGRFWTLLSVAIGYVGLFASAMGMAGAGGSSGSGCGAECTLSVIRFATAGATLLTVSAISALLSIGTTWTLQRQALPLWASISLTSINLVTVLVAGGAAAFMASVALT